MDFIFQCVCSEDVPQYNMDVFVSKYQPTLFKKWKSQHDKEKREIIKQWKK